MFIDRAIVSFQAGHGGDGCGAVFIRGERVCTVPQDELLPTLLSYIDKL